MKQIQFLTLDFIHSPVPQPAAYLETGINTGSVPTLLLLHGFMGNASCWLPLMEQLQPQMKSQIHCLALDLMGFGDSAKPAIKYDIAKEVAFVRQFIEQRQLDSCPSAPVYLVGHSFGGWVAAAYALAYPAQVQGLILAAPAGIRDDSFCGRYDHLRPLLWQTPLVDGILALLKPFAKWMGHQETLGQIVWMRQSLNAQPAARSFLVDRMRPEDAIDTVEQSIHQLRIPTLVITGDRDETIPLWHSQTYAREIPNAQLAIIPNASHSLPQDYASELADLIRFFLSREISGVAESEYEPQAKPSP